MLMTEPVNGTYPSSDILQFYCRTEETQTRDECLFVRYYINKYDHTVCRQATIYDPNGVSPAILPDYSDPRLLTNATNSDLAIFENARTLAILFEQWDPNQKLFIKEGAPADNPPARDTLQVTLIFTDQYKQARMDAYHADSSNKIYQANAFRTYSKVFAIPASFKQRTGPVGRR